MRSDHRLGVIQAIVFEDQTWRGLRPLCASLPVFEQRCGLFNTRERVELAGGSGILLCREHLAGLVQPGPWALNVAPDPGRRSLWLAARLAPSFALVQELLAAAAGDPAFSWHDQHGLLAAAVPAGRGPELFASWQEWQAGRASTFAGPAGLVRAAADAGSGARLEVPAGTGPAESATLAAALRAATGPAAPALSHAWDLVPATTAALAADLAAGVAAGGWERRPFGLVAVPGAQPAWEGRTAVSPCRAADLPPGAWLLGDALWLDRDVTIAPGAVIDTRKGAVIIDRGCDIASHTLLEGPLYLGPGCRVKAGARLYGESSFGVGNRLAGEIGESTFGDFTNKQHEGFIGHAVLGSWVNLGAMTTCSDLKNNYGSVKVDLGDGLQETGQRFVGLLAGDHVKTAIGTLFNTGTCVGFASNIFGEGMPPKHVPAFSWGGRAGDPPYALQAAAATAEVVLGRRGCRFLPEHAGLFASLVPR